MYANIQNSVRLRFNTSKFFDILLSVKQGESLSPILFVNDMHEEMSESINASKDIERFLYIYISFW